MGLIFDIPPRALEKVLYFAAYIVLDAGRFRSCVQAASDGERVPAGSIRENVDGFRAAMGAEAIKELLEAIDLEKETAMN